jgi:ZIP family zinc transporter
MTGWQTILAALLVAAANLAGGWLAGRLAGQLRLIAGFSAGFLISVAMQDLLPDSISALSGRLEPRQVMMLAVAGFAGFLVLDKLHLFHFHEIEGHAGHVHRHAHVGSLAALGMVLHSLVDGAVVAAVFRIAGAAGWLTAVALLLHKFADGVGIVTLVGPENPRGASRFLWAASAAVLVGCVVLQNAGLNPPLLGYLLAPFAGLFLYVGAGDLLPRAYSGSTEGRVIAANLLGFASAGFAHLLKG